MGNNGTFDPYNLAFYRYFIAFITLMIIHSKNKERFKFLKNYNIYKYVIAGLIVAIFSIVLFIGLQHTDSGIGGVLLNSNAIFIGFFAYIILHENITKNEIIGLIIGILGVLLIFAPNIGSEGTLLGNLLTFLSGIIWAIFTITIKGWFYKKEDTIGTMMISMGVASIFVFIYLIITKNFTTIQNLNQLLLILYIGIVPTALAFSSYLYLANKESATIAGSVQLMVPIFNLALSYIIFRDKITPVSWIGIVIIMLSMIIVQNYNE